MGRADPGTVISELLSVQKLVALAGSVNRRLRSRMTVDENRCHSAGETRCISARQGPWNFGVLAAALAQIPTDAKISRAGRPGALVSAFMAQACRFSQRFGLRLGGYSCQNGFCASSNRSRRVSPISARSRSLRRCNANRDQTRSRQPSNSDRSLH
jgi:hypothetical protein